MNNREFKFRVWDIDRKRFTKTAFVAMDSINIKMTLDGKLTWECEYGNGEVNGIIQQFTGVKDKHGKDIYEGDFLKNFEFPVSFENGCFSVGIVYDLMSIPLSELNYSEIQIIGNIFENPELLYENNII